MGCSGSKEIDNKDRMNRRKPDPTENNAGSLTRGESVASNVSGNNVKKYGASRYSMQVGKLHDPYENVVGIKVTVGMWSSWIGEGTLGQVKGIIRTKSGFINGGEVVEGEFDPNVTTYEQVLTDFAKDVHKSGKLEKSVLSLVFYHDAEQHQIADKLFSGTKVEVVPAKHFDLGSYGHQKYYLQRYKNVMKILDFQPGPEFIKSHIATKLDGYFLGYGTIENFDADCAQMNLPKHIVKYIRGIVMRIGISTEKGGLHRRL